MSQLKGNEFIDPKFFDELKKGAEESLKLVKDLKGVLKSDLQSKSTIKIVEPKTVKDIENFNKSVKETRTVIDNLTKAEAKELQLQKELSKLKNDKVYQKQAKEIERLRQEKNAINKATRDEVKAEREVNQEYKKQSRLLNDLRNQYKNLAVAGKANTKQAKDLLAQIKPLDKKLKDVDATVGQSQRNVGNYASAFRNLASSIGLTLGVAGVFRVLRGSVGIVRDFEKQSATLAGVLGKTREEIKGLDEDAKRLGATTEFTATQVGSLQEAYARLGFSQQQILDTTEATLRGATAFQSELGETAELVGSTLNQFGLDASESAKVVDVLARSTQISALNFKQLQTSLPIVGKTAQVAGLSLERTAGLLGVLANNGIDASTASTGLRNVFLDLAKKGISYDDALSQINNSQDKLALATELFGKRGATVAITLAQNIESADKFNDSLLNAGGTAEQLAKTQLNTLDGALKLLNSAWEGYILQLNDATNGGNTLTKGIRFLSENLETILDTVGKAALAFTTYKTTVFLTTNVLKAYNAVSNLFQRGIKGVTGAFRNFNKVAKANVIGAVVAAIVLAVTVLKDFIGTLSTAEKTQRRLNEAQKEAEVAIAKEKASLESLLVVAKDETRSKQERERAIKELNKISPEYLGNLTLETINTNEATKAIDNYIKSIEKKAKATALNNQLVKIEEELAQERNKRLEDQITLGDKVGQAFSLKNLNPFVSKTDKIINNASELAKKGLENRAENIKSLEEQKKGILDQIKASSTLEDVLGNETKSTKSNTKAIKENTRAKKENINLNDFVDSDEEDLAFFNSQQVDEAKDNKEELEILNQEFTVSSLEEQDRRQKQLEEKEARALEERKKTYQSLNNVADSFAQRQQDRANKEIENIDRVIDASQNRINRLRDFAVQGNLTAENSIAVEEKAQAEATLRKEKEIQKQKRIESSLALLKTYTSSLEGGQTPSQAIADVLKNGTLLAGLINALPSFDVGTDNTSKHINGFSGGVDGKGGFLAVNHPNEKIFNAEDSAKIGFDVPNSEVADTFGMVKRGLLVPKSTNEVVVNWQSNEAILNKFDSLEKTVKNLHIPEVTYDFDNIEKVVTKIIKSKNSTNKVNKKSTGIW